MCSVDGYHSCEVMVGDYSAYDRCANYVCDASMWYCDMVVHNGTDICNVIGWLLCSCLYYYCVYFVCLVCMPVNHYYAC